MTDFKKIEHLYQGHNCSNCRITCENMDDGICERLSPNHQSHFHNCPSKNPKMGDLYYHQSTQQVMVYLTGKWLPING